MHPPRREPSPDAGGFQPAARIRNSVFVLGLISTSLLAHVSLAQAPSQADPAAPGDETVKLQAFQVVEKEDSGYLSKNTLAGTRTTERILDIPQEIAIANRQLIADLGVDVMLPAVQFVTGGVTRRGLNVGDDLYIRGFRSSNTLKDGFAFASNAVGTLYDVDRVEVVKGPAALIFGQASFTGGIVNYVSRRPTRQTEIELKAAFGSYNYKRGEAHISGPALDRKDFRYRVDVGSTDSDYGPRRFSYYKDKFIGAGFEYDLNANTRLVIDGSFADVDYNYSNTLHDPVTRQVLQQSDDFTVDEAWARYPTMQERATATLTSEIADRLNVRLFIGYNNSTNDWLRPFVLGFQPDNNTVNRLAEDFKTSAHSTTAQLDILKQFDTGPVEHKFSVGGEQQYGNSVTVNESFALDPLNVRNPVWGALPSTTPGTGSVTYNDHSFGRSIVTGVYALEQASLFDGRFTLIAGLRYNAIDSHGGAQGTDGAPRNDSKTVTRFGALYHPVKNVSVYYNNSESFLFNGGLDYLGRQLVPSVGTINEYGVKAELFNGAIVASGSYFDIELTNVRVTFTQGPGDPQPGNSGARQTGVEHNKGFEVSLATSKDFEVGRLDFVATAYAGDIRDSNGLKPANPPNNTNSLFGVFKFTKGPLQGVGFGGGMFYEGERVGPNLLGAPLKYPSFTTANALVSYTVKRVAVQLNVDNLTDEATVVGGEGALWTVTGPGRNYKVSATYRF